MFDHTLDPAALIEEWLQGYHGPIGGPIVKQFMALIAGNVSPGYDGCFGSCETVKAKFLPPLAVLQAGQMFARGAKVMEGQPGPHAARLRAAAIQVLDVALLRWEELAAFATGADFPWPFGRFVFLTTLFMTVTFVVCNVNVLPDNVLCLIRSKSACLALFSQTWAESRMSKINEMDGAGRDLMCSLQCYERSEHSPFA